MLAGRSGNPVGDFFSAFVEGDTQTWTFDAVDLVEVNVESFNGDVMVVADPKLTAAKVTVTPQAVHGFQRHDDARSATERVHATVEKVPGDLGPVISVRTTTDDPEPHYLRAHVYIEAPGVDGLVIRTSNGSVMMKNITGAVDATTSYGDMRLMTPQPMTRPVTLVTRQGDIDYRVRGESSGLFDLATVGGTIKLRCRYGRWIAVDPANTVDRMVATLNGGENPVIMRTVDGDIRVAVVSDPMQVGLFIVDP